MSGFKKGNRNDEDSDSDDSTGNVNNEAVAVKEEEKEEDTTCANPNVVTKYQEAAKIANEALTSIIAACKADVAARELIRIGENIIKEKCNLIFRNKVKGKEIEKGVAFPVCISVNECVCHFNPLDSEEIELIIKDNDLVKIDLGVHVDGYIAVVAHTVNVGVADEAPVADTLANCYSAAYVAAQAATSLIRPGKKNSEITKVMNQIMETYGVTSISGTLMHQLKRFVMDGNKMIMLRDETDQKVDSCEFEENEVYVVDIAVTNGEGKPKEVDTKTTIYKRVVDRKYHLKVKNSRMIFTEICQKFPSMPFSVRALSDEKTARVGLRECLAHDLIVPYPVLYEKKGVNIVHYKCTILVLPGGNLKITGMDLAPPKGVDTKELDAKLPEEIKNVIAEEEARKAKKAAKKNKKKAAKKK